MVALELYRGTSLPRHTYAQWLEHKDDIMRAAELYNETLLRARRSPKYYRRAQKQWIDIAGRQAR